MAETTDGAPALHRARPTLIHVAELAGVAPITVSRALRRPDLVAEETRDRIDNAIRDSGYVPDLVARSFRQSRTGIVAAIVPSLESAVYGELLQGLAEALRANDFELMVGASGMSLDLEERILRAFIGRRPDAIVLSGGDHTPGAHAMLSRAGVPIVETGPLLETPIDMNVGFSEESAVATIAEALLDAGYRQIGFICGPTADNERARRRLAGFHRAARATYSDRSGAVILTDGTDIGAGGRALVELMERDPDIDCVLCSSDVFAVSALLQCQRMGWPVPDRLAIAGYLGLQLGAEMVPALTTVAVPRFEIGLKAGRLLVDRLSGSPIASPTINLGFEVIRRASA